MEGNKIPEPLVKLMREHLTEVTDPSQIEFGKPYIVLGASKLYPETVTVVYAEPLPEGFTNHSGEPLFQGSGLEASIVYDEFGSPSTAFVHMGSRTVVFQHDLGRNIYAIPKARPLKDETAKFYRRIGNEMRRILKSR